MFGKRLDNNQKSLIRLGVTIPDDNKLQFYLEEIYDKKQIWQTRHVDMGTVNSHHQKQFWPNQGIFWENCEGDQHIQAEYRRQLSMMQQLYINKPNDQLQQQTTRMDPADCK